MRALYIKGGGWSVAFSLGVVHYLIESHEDKLRDVVWAGWSGGTLALFHTLCVLHDQNDNLTPLQRHTNAIEWWFKNTVRQSSKHALFNNWSDRWVEYFIHLGIIRNRDLYKEATGKLHVGLTNLGPGRLPRPQPEIISRFRSNAHLVDVIYHSCWWPALTKRPTVSLMSWDNGPGTRIDGLCFENKLMLSDQFKRDDILVIGRRADGRSDIVPDTDIFGNRGLVSKFDVSVHPTYLFELYDNGYHAAAKYDRDIGIK
jgi:hypothetical protein